MDRIRVKPVIGRIVRDPERGDDLPPEGREVRRTVYWERCRQAGDVVVVLAEPATKVSKGAKP